MHMSLPAATSSITRDRRRWWKGVTTKGCCWAPMLLLLSAPPPPPPPLPSSRAAVPSRVFSCVFSALASRLRFAELLEVVETLKTNGLAKQLLEERAFLAVAHNIHSATDVQFAFAALGEMLTLGIPPSSRTERCLMALANRLDEQSKASHFDRMEPFVGTFGLQTSFHPSLDSEKRSGQGNSTSRFFQVHSRTAAVAELLSIVDKLFSDKDKGMHDLIRNVDIGL
mmetsp:Transcript_44860/g.87961  ORF Transcript_44860/g.87961 Transcript_44860/m.87961 type:complete len:226 (+) Transcript_44860:645-1322(+)